MGKPHLLKGEVMPVSSDFLISLSPTHLSAMSVRRGRIQQAETVRLDAAEWDGLWGDGLMRLDQPLRQLLSRFSGRSRVDASLIYQSPTLTTQVTTSDIAGAVAREAARTKIREVVGFDAPVSVCELGDASRAGGRASCSHTQTGTRPFARSTRGSTGAGSAPPGWCPRARFRSCWDRPVHRSVRARR